MKLELTRRKETGSLADLLEAQGCPLDLRCGGNGSCGRCRVQLLSGTYRIDGEEVSVSPPGISAKACRTVLTSENGCVEVPETSYRSLSSGSILADWTGAPLARISAPVIGVDIGTTTVAAVKLVDGRITARASAFNEQSRFGDNVISRIVHAGSSPEALEEERKAVADTINKLLAELDGSDCIRIAVAGNTVMSLLFHGIDPTPVGTMPFLPPTRCFPIRTARDCGLISVPPDIPVLTVPAIAGYVGGDLVAGIARTNPQPGEMLVDIGTNCEIVFRTSEKIFCTAAAAGPAFEGGGIPCGSRAVEGAIDHYFPDGTFSVLGGGNARGLCGSAMIDFLAVLRRKEQLNEFGRLQPEADRFAFTDSLSISEEEISQLLKAKAAVAAGIQTLADYCATPVKRILLAGGFARYLDLANAKAIGMLPDVECRIVGNTSLAGAAELAAKPEMLSELERLSAEPCELPLNALPEFENNYIDGLMLP